MVKNPLLGGWTRAMSIPASCSCTRMTPATMPESGREANRISKPSVSQSSRNCSSTVRRASALSGSALRSCRPALSVAFSPRIRRKRLSCRALLVRTRPIEACVWRREKRTLSRTVISTSRCVCQNAASSSRAKGTNDQRKVRVAKRMGLPMSGVYGLRIGQGNNELDGGGRLTPDAHGLMDEACHTVPGRDSVSAGRQVRKCEAAIGIGFGGPLIRRDDDSGSHVGMQMAVHEHHARLGERYRAGLVPRIIAEVEGTWFG